ncbi:MAG: OB-fold putative lipoprotein [Chitinophagaceae bacterium]|nr:OB-fold putative lipoprotein [Chitinophagaceae bacterium]
MKTLKPIILILILIGIATAVYVWFFEWNKPKTEVADADAIKIEAATLFNAYTKDEASANKLYLEKVLQVNGEVTEVIQNEEGLKVVLLKTEDAMFGVNCTLEQKNITVSKGEKVTLKGICTGYLTDVVLIRCYKVN